MKYIKEYLERELRISPLGTLTTKSYESTCGEYTGETILIDGKEIGLVVCYIDYIDWLEKNFKIEPYKE